MSRFAPRGLALTGSVMAIVVASLLFIGGILILVESRGDDRMILSGSVAMLVGSPGIVLGALGCAIKAGPILANAIFFSAVSLFGYIGISSAGRLHLPVLGLLLLHAITAVFLYIGSVQAAKYQKAMRAQ
jgi:hypothetical protein